VEWLRTTVGDADAGILVDITIEISKIKPQPISLALTSPPMSRMKIQDDRGKGKGRERKPKWTASVLQSGPVGERGGGSLAFADERSRKRQPASRHPADKSK
jgi:hypothetical protein